MHISTVFTYIKHITYTFCKGKKSTPDAFNMSSCFCVIKAFGQLLGMLLGVSQAAPYSDCQYMTPPWLSEAYKHQSLCWQMSL